ncbi:hypothetical protein BDF20DRAFT_845875 [Mycotypha africana]|uniref:uncharacterized protein n=1 Tax=Mycotypha africana TaxID=64632 RepID=UPI002301D7A1|nr:uncharacterized protein BDF20DRAFT_845875 [Mycotypha africana]KAI8991696.1 hypothetical protein BDF20DRAFT_845875 [Mycotypha africana]
MPEQPQQTDPVNNEQQQLQQSVKRRRKKASRACSHCQKAHLTCDDSRPCQRCIKRGLEDTCTDGVRKKAKYLQEDENVDQRFQTATNSVTSVGSTPIVMNYSENDGFRSDTVRQQYNTISNLIPFLDSNRNTTTTTNNTNTGNDANNIYEPPTMMDTFSQQSQPLALNWASLIDPNALIMNNIQSATNSPISTPPLQPRTIVTSGASTPSQLSQSWQPPQSAASETVNDQQQQQVLLKRRKGVGNTPHEVYARVNKPYNYAESYHHLIEYVRQKMGRDELIRISRALVQFRPSYMSIVASLTEEDLVYMEKCVQRTLLEFEKMISFSGTPTVVWRRTGEIVLVGKEFLLLTQWSKEILLGKKTYIYELMDNGSAIEYWEKFSQHAFDSLESGVYMSVILMSPTYRPVPCTFCFTLKRDIFDLPCVVVGNFLPILGANR